MSDATPEVEAVLVEYLSERGWRNRPHKPIVLPAANRLPASYICWGCNEPWPCPMIRMAAEVVRLRGEDSAS
jgi:hypothetical protein